MNLTDDEPDNELVAIFEREFVPVARRLSEQGIETLVTGFDAECASYYIPRKRKQLSRADFELNLDDLEEVKRYFRSGWTDAESEILSDLLEQILALSVNYESVQIDEDVSPFVYAMF